MLAVEDVLVCLQAGGAERGEDGCWVAALSLEDAGRC